MSLTMIQAQERYIRRLREAHPGHLMRVKRAARYELYMWAVKRGYDAELVCRDAHDMFVLEERSNE